MSQTGSPRVVSGPCTSGFYSRRATVKGIPAVGTCHRLLEPRTPPLAPSTSCHPRPLLRREATKACSPTSHCLERHHFPQTTRHRSVCCTYPIVVICSQIDTACIALRLISQRIASDRLARSPSLRASLSCLPSTACRTQSSLHTKRSLRETFTMSVEIEPFELSFQRTWSRRMSRGSD